MYGTGEVYSLHAIVHRGCLTSHIFPVRKTGPRKGKPMAIGQLLFRLRKIISLWACVSISILMFWILWTYHWSIYVFQVWRLHLVLWETMTHAYFEATNDGYCACSFIGFTELPTSCSGLSIEVWTALWTSQSTLTRGSASTVQYYNLFAHDVVTYTLSFIFWRYLPSHRCRTLYETASVQRSILS